MSTHTLRSFALPPSAACPVICQKPMATSLDEAEGMVAACRKSSTPFFVHENWRWQAPIREVRHILDDGLIGRPFRARIDMISGFPVFQNQPFLQDLEQFILADLGSHILDVARFLFGEARRLYCQTQRVHVGIRGEDVATVVLTTDRDVNVVCQMAYAENHLEHECFPQTLLFIEGTRGSMELAPDYWVRLTAENGTLAPPLPADDVLVVRSAVRRRSIEHRRLPHEPASTACKATPRWKPPATTTCARCGWCSRATSPPRRTKSSRLVVVSAGCVE